MTPRRKAHKLWIRKQRERFPFGVCDQEARCMNCYCDGNSECGQEPNSDEGCTLDEQLMCPCCNTDSEPLSDMETDAITGQGSFLPEPTEKGEIKL